MKPSPVRLTEKQQQFVLRMADGETQSDAYRSAYNAAGMSDPSVWVEAHRTANHPKVRARIVALGAQAEAERRMRRFLDEERILEELTHTLLPWRYAAQAA